MRVHIRHDTVYSYESDVSTSLQYLRLRPRTTAQLKVIDWNLKTPGMVSSIVDGFGNPVTVLSIEKPVKRIAITAAGTVEITGKSLLKHDQAFPPALFLRHTDLTEPTEAMRDFAAGFAQNKKSLQRMMRKLHDEMEFLPGSTTVSQPAADAFAQKKGVCQDFTHVFLTCCRHIGVPVRYVSGYLLSDADEEVATHAWAEAFIGQTWHTFDVANNTIAPESHIKLAVGLDYLDVAPVRGVRSGGGQETMETNARVTRGHRPAA